MDDYTPTTPEFNLGLEVARAFALSAASVAGMFAGMVAFGAAADSLEKWKKRKPHPMPTEES